MYVLYTCALSYSDERADGIHSMIYISRDAILIS